jgi:hypothetical protein
MDEIEIDKRGEDPWNKNQIQTATATPNESISSN